MKPALATTFLLLLASLPSANGAWQKVPAVEGRIVVVSSNSIPGTKVLSSKGFGQADTFVSNDPTAPISAGVGVSEAIIQLGDQRLVNSATFINDTLEGKVVLSGSSDKSTWTPLGQALFTPADRNVVIDFAGVQVRYLKVELEASKAGTLRSFQVFGADTDKDYEISQNESGSGGQLVNVAGGMGGSRVIYVHPSPSRGNEVTGIDKAQSKFDFPESDEKYRTVIYDLGATRTLSEFGSVHSPRPVRLEVFTFSELPEKEDWKGRMSFDPSVLNSTQPVVTKEDSQGLGYIKVKTQKPIKARYVALRWEPDFNPPGFFGMPYFGGFGFSPARFNPFARPGSRSGGGVGGGSSGPYALGIAPLGMFGNLGTAGYAGGGGSLNPIPPAPGFVPSPRGGVGGSPIGPVIFVPTPVASP